MKIFNDTFQLIEKSLDYSARKNESISNNIANVDTPNYKAQHIAFKDVLTEKISEMKTVKTHPKHYDFTGNSPHVQTISQGHTVYNHNGNNVDIDKEMTNLAKNQIFYRGMTDQLNNKLQILSTVVKGGR